MRELFWVIVTISAFGFILAGINKAGIETERAKWCNKYTDRTEYQGCMKVGSEYEKK